MDRKEEEEEEFGLQCERFAIHVGANTHTHLAPNQGYLIPISEHIALYNGLTRVAKKMPWMDTFTYAWSFDSMIEQDVEFIRVTAR